MRQGAVWAAVLLMTGLAACVDDGPTERPAPRFAGPEWVRDLDEPGPEGGGIEFSKIHTPDEIAAYIDEVATRPGVEVQVIGQSIEGRPIHLVSVGEGSFDLWIQGRIHGNEPTGGEAILLALEALTAEDPFVPHTAPESFRQFAALRDELLQRLTFHFIPVANPDGAAAYQRGNLAQQDLNREFFLFTQPEPQQIMEAFWQVRPDGCIDLHNEGIGTTDWDAFNPDGPLIEPEIYDLMIEDIWLALYEVDAAGGRGGGPNEFYNIANPPVVGPVVNPTAFHPGTHDMFCSTRGAPGYTPEGAISSGSNGNTDYVHAWSTRLHQVTIAASAFHWAGFYGPETVHVEKTMGSMPGPGTFTATAPGASQALGQVVWRNQAEVNDWSTPPVVLSMAGPEGSASTDENDPRALQWSQTVTLPAMAQGDYTLDWTSTLSGEIEARIVFRTAQESLATVERDGQDIKVTAHADIRFRVSDASDPVGNVTLQRGAADSAILVQHKTTVGERAIVTWGKALAAGESFTFSFPGDREGVGPFRWTAISDDTVHMGVERVRNAPPDAWQSGGERHDHFA